MPIDETPRIAIVGAGATGAFLAAKLAGAGVPATLIARGASLEVIGAKGITVVGPDGDSHVVRPVRVVAPDAIVEHADLVFVCVKTYDTPGVQPVLSALAGPSTSFVCLQNGVRGEGILAEHFGEDRVIGGVLYVGARRTGPGVVLCTSGARVLVGPYAPSSAAVARRVDELLTRAGLDSTYVAAVLSAKWEKFLFNCGLNPLTAITGQRLGSLLSQPLVRDVFDRLVDEAVEVARAIPVPLANGYRTRVAETASKMDISSSMAEDLVTGRKIELDAFSGYVIEMADRLRIDVPTTRTVHGIMTALVTARGER